MDLETIAIVVEKLKQQRRDLIELIYELSGISDLARGQTDPNETLGALQAPLRSAAAPPAGLRPMSPFLQLLVDLIEEARELGCTEREIVINSTPTKLRELIASKKGKRAA